MDLDGTIFMYSLVVAGLTAQTLLLVASISFPYAVETVCKSTKGLY